MNKNLLKTIFNGVALAMGVAVVVLNIVNPPSVTGVTSLLGIGVAEHVPLPNHATHARQLHATRLQRRMSGVLKLLRARRNLPRTASRKCSCRAARWPL